MPHVHFIRGLPGSGKSTKARDYAGLGYTHLEADRFFTVGGRYEFDRARIGEAHAACRAAMAEALSVGLNVVIANTFSQRWEMESYLAVAAVYGATVTEETVSGMWQNVHDVPLEIIAAMRERWEA